ncbi:MAG: hypothetical protein H7X80_03070 [bacterium]|nr:hypothetical protein [Candidatus Kapabacteria bacterium]
MNFRPIAFVTLALLAIAFAPELLACPACKEQVRGQAGASLSAGFNYTVFGLIGMVFGLVATVATVIIRSFRRRSVI